MGGLERGNNPLQTGAKLKSCHNLIIGPEHAYYRDQGRIGYAYATDDEVMAAFQLCSRFEGIIPALESTHALVYGLKRAKEMQPEQILVINLSGRGDKDVQQVAALLAASK